VTRLLLFTAVTAAAAVAVAAPASATNECRGLQVCVPVAGPWVLASPGEIQFDLACPKKFVVGGLDAELSSRAIDVGFVGSLGSPVNPGITTSTEAVFLGRLVRSGDAAASFRPHIGCIPASGGGQRTPTAYDAFAPGKPSAREIKQFTVSAGRTRRYTGRCAGTERLVAATHAIGFFSASPPTASLAHAIRVIQSVRQGLVRLTVSATRAAAESRAVVQLDLVCAAR
jgi:hypothetical protein